MQSRIIQPPDELEQIEAEFSTRPLRFGFIVNREIEQDVLMQIYQYNTSLWGGLHNIFIPTDGENIRNDWWRQLLFHDPDVVFLVGNIKENLANDLYVKLQPLQIFKWDESSLEELKGKPTRVSPLTMAAILENLYAKNGKVDPEQSLIRYPMVQDSLFAPYFHLMCGSWLPESRFQDFAEANLGMTEIKCSPKNLKDYLAFLDELENWLTPLQLTAQQLTPTYSISGLGGYAIVVSTGMLDDLFIYHALRWEHKSSSGKLTVAIVPYSAISNDDYCESLAEWFGAKVGGNTFKIISYSIGLDSLIEFRDNLKKFLPYRKVSLADKEGWAINIERCNIDASVPTVTHMKQRQVVNVIGNKHSFEIEKPSFLSRDVGQRYKNKRWICEVNLSPGFGNKRGFRPSMFPDFNFVLSNYPDRRYFRWESFVRIARGQLALPATSDSNVMTISLPSHRRLIQTACENAGYQIDARNSIYYEGMVNLLGGLENARFLQNPHILELFNQPDMLKENGLTLLDMYKNKRCTIPDNEKKEFQDWIQELAGKEILLRGYNLECPTCGLMTWYELRAVQEHMTCVGCRATFQIPIRMDFAYHLNHLFIERHNQGTITVLLTLLLLHNTVSDSLIWQADTVFLKDNSKIEIDIIAMCDGHLVLAECKNSFVTDKQEKVDDLKRQLEREIDVAVNMEAQLFLFATLKDEIPDEIKNLLEQKDAQYDKLCVRLVTEEELRKGKFNKKDGNSDHYVTMYDVVGEILNPPPYSGDDCSAKDENWPSGAMSLW